ncbi:hypothetical protein J5N97_023671 [Dioscorea zingiberensis]|uniref:non-specific serine/threonine protein kinase n=1 Tax=Dioscorea zingiberensis TaxID=325984 RepID=A0A9D5H828_9LILI|nr:hypothetical protein J5N97_023671 [Dioscorea zingiberensis]
MECFSCVSGHQRELRNARKKNFLGDRSDTRSISRLVDSIEQEPEFPPLGCVEKKSNAHGFTFKELVAATKNFKPSNLVGEGGFGKVFKEGLQGNQEFMVEVLMLSTLRHPNLVTLIGYCAEKEERLLVYEYMANGSLENHLFDLRYDQEALNWNTRMKIALGAAKGLAYLHSANPPSRPFLYDRRRFTELADPLLQGHYPLRAFYQLVSVTSLCLHDHPETRPLMHEVVSALEYVASQPFRVTNSQAAQASAHAQTTQEVREGLEKERSMGNCLDSFEKSISPGPSTSKTGSSTTTTGKLSSISSRTTTTTLGLSTGSNFSVGENREISPPGQILEAPNLRIFTFAELKSATRNFKPDSVLGEGGFGTVFKGWVDEKTLNPGKSGVGMVVAVKKLNPESVQGLEEWQSEVNFLGRLSHPNLVKLLGYCLEDKELLLVYEFMAKGSLENHLFRRGAAYDPLPWNLRLKIAIGAARGLAFLHTSEKQIIYRDFKASNILLDTNYNAKISDFGLAKHGPTGGDSHVTTRVMGTYGYAAPEYVATGHLYVKSDVYGFGVVLLEMLSGQRALDTNRPSGQHNLVDWAKPYLSDRRKLARLMDPRLEGQYPSKGVLHAAQLTLRCLAGEPRSRPSMKEVVETLEQIEAMKSRSKDSTKDVPSPHHPPRNHGQNPVRQRSPLHPKHDGPGSRINHHSPKLS